MLLYEYEFKSCFAEHIEGLIDYKKKSGYIYDSAKYILIQFDRYCISNNISEPVITKELTESWGTRRTDESREYLKTRVSVIRQLSLYMISGGSDGYIPSHFSSNHRKLSYVMNDDEIRAFMKIVDEYRPKINADRFKILADEYRVLYRFIYCCGLRVSEARKLKISDMDFEKETALIRCSKGDKDRIIYMSSDVCKMCLDLIQHLKNKYGIISEYLFPSSDLKKPLQAASINLKFKEFWNKTPYAGNDYRHPTIHSLRYSFVVARINIWMENGENLNALMPYLSKYLGHSCVENTYYYYHQIESAFKIIRQKDIISKNIIPEVAYEE